MGTLCAHHTVLYCSIWICRLFCHGLKMSMWFWHYRQLNFCHFLFSFELSHFWCLSITFNTCLKEAYSWGHNDLQAHFLVIAFLLFLQLLQDYMWQLWLCCCHSNFMYLFDIKNRPDQYIWNSPTEYLQRVNLFIMALELPCPTCPTCPISLRTSKKFQFTCPWTRTS